MNAERTIGHKNMIENQEFTPPHPLNTAVLFLVFNRIDTSKQDLFILAPIVYLMEKKGIIMRKTYLMLKICMVKQKIKANFFIANKCIFIII